jgi:hypothetical protein
MAGFRNLFAPKELQANLNEKRRRRAEVSEESAAEEDTDESRQGLFGERLNFHVSFIMTPAVEISFPFFRVFFLVNCANWIRLSFSSGYNPHGHRNKG